MPYTNTNQLQSIVNLLKYLLVQQQKKLKKIDYIIFGCTAQYSVLINPKNNNKEMIITIFIIMIVIQKKNSKKKTHIPFYYS